MKFLCASTLVRGASAAFNDGEWFEEVLFLKGMSLMSGMFRFSAIIFYIFEL